MAPFWALLTCALWLSWGHAGAAQATTSINSMNHAPKVFSSGGKLILDLSVQEWNTPSSSEPIVAYYWKGKAQVPAPTLVLKPGDDVVIRVSNALPSFYQELLNATALRIMGLQFEKAPTELHEGDTVSVHTFKIRDDHVPGLHWYHNPPSHALQALAGAITVVDSSDDSEDDHVVENRLAHPMRYNAFLMVMQFRGLPAAASARALTIAENAASSSNQLGDGGDTRARGRRRRLEDSKGFTQLNRPVGYMVNGQREPTLSIKAGTGTVLDMVHVGGRHVLELELRPLAPHSDDGDSRASSTPATTSTCSMQVLANDGVDFESPRQASYFPLGPYKRVRTLVQCSAPGDYSLVSVEDPDRDAITDPSRRWSQQIAIIHVEESGSATSSEAAADEVVVEQPAGHHTGVHVPTYLKDLSDEVGPFNRWEANLDGCPSVDSKQHKKSLLCTVADHRLYGRVQCSLASKVLSSFSPFQEVVIHTPPSPPGIALHFSSGHPFQILEYIPFGQQHADAAADNAYLTHWGRYGEWHDVFPPMSGTFRVRFRLGAGEESTTPELQYDAYPPYVVPSAPSSTQSVEDADDDVVIGESVGPEPPHQRDVLLPNKEGTEEVDMPPKLLLDLSYTDDIKNSTSLAAALEAYLEGYLNTTTDATTTTPDATDSPPAKETEEEASSPPSPASRRSLYPPLAGPRRLSSSSSHHSAACANKTASSTSTLSLHLLKSSDTYTVIRLLDALLSSSSSSSSSLAGICSLNVTLQHAYYTDDAIPQDDGQQGGFRRPSLAMRVAMVVGVAAGCVGLSLALAMHLAYRYKNRDDDGNSSSSMRASIHRSSSSFSRHRRRSTQVHDPTTIETQITELVETNPIHRMHSRTSSNSLTGPIIFPPPKLAPANASRQNTHRHGSSTCSSSSSSSSFHDGGGLSTSGSGSGRLNTSGSGGSTTGTSSTTLQGQVQPAHVNHSRSASMPHGGFFSRSQSC